MDSNAQLHDDIDLQRLQSKCGLHDLHQATPAPSTYIGSEDRRINHMLGCSQLIKHVKSSGSLSYLDGPQSDHRGLFVDIDPNDILGQPISKQSIKQPHTRSLKSGNPELVEAYHKAMLFTKWKETTSTSPSGRHLGHYKAIIKESTLLTCLRQFLHVTVQSGLTLRRWCNAVNILIEKDPGRPKLTRLRIIHLFEADINLFLKLIWGSRLVKRAVSLNLLNDGQHGSTPRKKAIDPIMLTQLTTDLCRILKHNLARFDNDASACYDRIIVALGMLAARRCGMPETAVQTHADSLKLMKYTVKTVHGISESNYHGTTFERMSFQSPDSSQRHARLIDAFVDDTSLGFTDPGLITLETMIAKLNHIAQTWENILKEDQFYDGSKTKTNHTLTTQGNTTDQTIIKRLPLSKASRILGVYLAPDGNFSKQLTVLKTKADGFAIKLRSPKLSPRDLKTFHQTMYAPAMRYVLPCLAIDEEELGHVQTKVVKSMLQKLGYPSTLPTEIRYGPVELGGLGLIDLRTKLGISTLTYMRNAIYSNTEAGKLMIMNVKYSQIESGILEPILEHPAISISYLTATWITSIRQFLFQHNTTISLTDTLKIQLRGSNDRCIMDAEALTRYTTQQKCDINLVRMYLQQIITLSDMSLPDGQSACTHHLQGDRRPNQNIRMKTWPRQASPSPSQKRLWRRYIASNFLRYSNKCKQSHGQLTKPTPPAENINHQHATLQRHI
ncbi:hypothetical protein MHU86_9346 [Fragilaria crotonensis]|nr:hypothetical protein MHU86_9346 [Fragilaria crotonensis]